MALGCAGGFSSDKVNYVKLISEFRDAFQPGMLIVMMVPGNKEYVTQGTGYKKVEASLV